MATRFARCDSSPRNRLVASRSGRSSEGIAEFTGLEIAGLENDGWENDGLENDGLGNDGLEFRGLQNEELKI